jgi:hypothetical protein
VSRLHNCLFRGASYLPMMAAVLAYTHLAPADFEGKPYFALNFGAEITSFLGFVAALWVIAYLTWTQWRNQAGHVSGEPANVGIRLHPGECWVVLAHGVAFGSGYALGASNASFLLILAVHHEVQYLYFTYAMARRPGNFYAVSKAGTEPALKDLDWKAACKDKSPLRTEVKHAASFLVWPAVGFAGAIAGGWSELEWIAPLGIGGLFCHYWLDGRIWTRGSCQN